MAQETAFNTSRASSGSIRRLRRRSIGTQVTLSDACHLADTQKKEVSIVLVGKSGAGKSTLARNILDYRREVEFCASHITENCDTHEATRNGVTVKVTDTVGLEVKPQSTRRGLKKLYKHTSGKADLIVFCIPVDPSSKFRDSNPAIMKSLQDAYGKDIWKQCIIAFTFSNLTLDRMKRKLGDDDNAIAWYKDLLLEHTTKFRAELERLKVKNINLRLVLGFETDTMSEDPATIVAIPTGDEPGDPILTDFKDPTSFTIRDSGLPEEMRIDITDWREVFFIEIIRKSTNAELKRKLLQYRFGRKVADFFTVGPVGGAAVGGLVGGAAIGAGVGAVIGLVGGPFGLAPGASVGAVIGGAVGAIGGGVGGEAASKIRKCRLKRKK
jgi:hypothetical protein